jgi:hypothetical protein
VETIPKLTRAHVVAAAAAHELNNELTVILSSVTRSIEEIEPDHPAHALLLELRSAAQRCAWRASVLLNYSARHGLRPSPTPLEILTRR